MKQFILLLLISILCLQPTLSQTKNVNIDNLGIQNITVRNSPTRPLKPLFFHYASRISSTPSTRQRINIRDINSSIYIAGQKKINEPISGDVIVSVDLGNLIVESSNISERREESKDKNGKITIYYFYKVDVVYKFASSYKITQDDNVLVEERVYTPYNSHYFSSKEYSHRKDASDFWNNNRDVLISDFTRELSINTASRASSTASTFYGFPVTKSYDIIKTINEKKHNENEAFRAAAQSLKEELQSMTGETGMNPDRLNGLIEYFESIPQKYTDPKLKADVRLRYAAYYNLCKIYLYLDQPENVRKYADLILSNGHDKKDEERLKKTANSLISMFERTNITSRHFNPNRYFENDTEEGEFIQTEEIIQTKDEEIEGTNE